MATRPKPRFPNAYRHLSTTLLGLVLLLATACSNRNTATLPNATAPEPTVGSDDPLPGLRVTIESVRGGPDANENVEVGDLLEVDFTVATDVGDPLELSSFARGAIMVSGPTFNYARVIASQSDVLTSAVKRASGAYTYRFSVPVPTTYLAPLNDTPSFTDGELTGTPLLAGTYTVALELRKDYTIDGTTYRDPGNASFDFLLGSAATLAPREVVTLANCNQCHSELRAHGNNRTEIKNCLVCHTSGAEDGNDPATGGGTPGVSIDFRVLIHKIHSGNSLPSVQGVATNADGSRNYDATPKPYIVQGFMGSLHDFSDVVFPVWPSLASPMPADKGYTDLLPSRQAQEDAIRSGAVACAKCHGDPDGDGPLPAPSQGDIAYTQPSRRACGSCHDDWDPDLPYRSNNISMLPQPDDSGCKQCHKANGGGLLDVVDAHTHPLSHATLAPGIVFDVTSVVDVGNGNGRFETGEKIRVTTTIQDGSGTDLAATSLSRIEAVISGPTANPNLVLYAVVPPAGIGAGPTYTFNLPQNQYYESVGFSTPGNQMFATAKQPHWNISGAATSLQLATATLGSTTLMAEAPARQNFIDVQTGLGAAFSSGDYILLENLVPTRREYLRVQNIEGDRLWFSSAYTQSYAPGLTFAHPIGATVDRITRIDVPASSYSLDPMTGVITETTEFGTGEVLVSYTSDFEVPADYPGTFNDSPDLDQTWGDWVGLPLLSGTYNLGLHGRRSFSVGIAPDTTSYAEASQPDVQALLFGTAATIETAQRIDSTSNCYGCHTDIQFHGGIRRGVETCLLCHGVAGAEDAPTYVYPSSTPTPGVTIDFRTMLHKIHSGKELTAGAGYVVNGFGGSSHSFEHVGFPAMPGGSQKCSTCHGENNTAWIEPAPRQHPNATAETRVWRAACGSCHDSTEAQTHINDAVVAFGEENCAACHGVNRPYYVRTMHQVR